VSFTRLLRAEVMKKVFAVLFAIALISGLANTVAANVQLGTNLRVLASN